MTGFGEYSTVSYVHPLRGERLNLGVLVWHPSKGAVCRFIPNVSRVRAVDERVSVARVVSQLDEIEKALLAWTAFEDSPLRQFSREFTRGVVVAAPVPARISDVESTLERLSSCLLPTAFMRASSARQFNRSFTARFARYLRDRHVQNIETDIAAPTSFAPVAISVVYDAPEHRRVWRTASFASLQKADEQLILAKAVHAENADLRAVQRYRHAEIGMAVQMPREASREGFDTALTWLHRDVNRVELFHDLGSIDQKLAALAGID